MMIPWICAVALRECNEDAGTVTLGRECTVECSAPLYDCELPDDWDGHTAERRPGCVLVVAWFPESMGGNPTQMTFWARPASIGLLEYLGYDVGALLTDAWEQDADDAERSREADARGETELSAESDCVPFDGYIGGVS